MKRRVIPLALFLTFLEVLYFTVVSNGVGRFTGSTYMMALEMSAIDATGVYYNLKYV